MTREIQGGAVLGLLAVATGATFISGPHLVAWVERSWCADGRMETFTQIQLGVNLLVLVALAGAGWRHQAWRGAVLRRVGWVALACGLVPAGLYVGSLQIPAWTPWFAEHGWLEWSTPILALLACGLFSHAALRRWRGPWPDPTGAIAHAFLAAGAWLLMLEELDWGQVIFGWPTSEILFSSNLQGSTNLHNFFNPAFPVLYDMAGWALAGAMFFSLLRRAPATRRGWTVLAPPRALVGLATLAFLFRFSHEVFEQLFAWLLVFHAGIDSGKGGCGAPPHPRSGMAKEAAPSFEG